MNIVVFGAGYVGLSLAVLLARQHDVTLVDIVPGKVDLVNSRKSPIADAEIEQYLRADADGTGKLNLKATTEAAEASSAADFAVIATPTDYDPNREYFDTSSVEAALSTFRDANAKAWVVIKSTVPVGYTEGLAHQLGDAHLLFSPEFLREGKALYDNLHPSRIVVGMAAEGEDARHAAEAFAAMLAECSLEDAAGVERIVCQSHEAECIKLFANTYLAMRVAYFNELDTYAQTKGLDSATILKGVCLDPRIGGFYNNPSFGYGGYCLPKDTKQLLANYRDVPQDIIEAVVQANRTRKDFVADELIGKLRDLTTGDAEPVVGIFHLTMKTGSDNFRHSSVQGVIKRLVKRGVTVLVYEPLYDGDEFFGCEVTDDLASFKRRSTVIAANRWSDALEDVSSKVYTRDMFRRD